MTKLRVKELCVEVCVKELCVCVSRRCVCVEVPVFTFVCSRLCVQELCVCARLCVKEACVSIQMCAKSVCVEICVFKSLPPSAVPATQNAGLCHQVPQLQRRMHVDVTKC